MLTVKDGSQSKTGKITGGYTSGNGGGVYVHGGGALAITGGAITGNQAAQGGGVYVADGSFSVSGVPKITGNTCNGAANNVYLSGGATIDVADGLDSGAAIGLTTASKPESDGMVTITQGLKNRGDLAAFASDEGYEVIWSDNGQEAVLARKIQYTAEGYTGVYDDSSHGITVKVDESIGDYKLEFGEKEGEYGLSASPTYVQAGEYTVYFRITARGGITVTDSRSVIITEKPEPTPPPESTETAPPTPTAMPTPESTETATPTPTETPAPEPAGPDYTLLARMKTVASDSTALDVKWTKVSKADGYDVFFARCGKDYKEKDAVTVTGLRTRFSKLSWHTNYKAYVRAFKWVHGKKVYIGKASPEVHAITGGYDDTYCNARSVTLSRRSLTLNVGRSKAVKARVKGVKKGRKLIRHGAAVRWYSSNVNVAVVDENGNITARDRGRCTVYALAMNGVRAKVNVTVE